MQMESSLNKVKISIIEDSEIHSEWLRAELENDQLFEVVSQDHLGRQGIISVKERSPDVALLDFQLEDLTGQEVAKELMLTMKK
ncbi:MAG: response regulator [Gammaproteobacteria bacterium]